MIVRAIDNKNLGEAACLETWGNLPVCDHIFNAIMNCFLAAKEGYAQSFQNKVSFDVTVMVDGTEIRLKGLGTLIIINNCGL